MRLVGPEPDVSAAAGTARRPPLPNYGIEGALMAATTAGLAGSWYGDNIRQNMDPSAVRPFQACIGIATASPAGGTQCKVKRSAISVADEFRRPGSARAVPISERATEHNKIGAQPIVRSSEEIRRNGRANVQGLFLALSTIQHIPQVWMKQCLQQ